MNTDTIANFDSLYGLILHFDSEEKCEKHLAELRWNGEVACPTCDCKKVGELQGKRKQFKCYGCKRKFSVKTGSIFHNSKLPLLKWFIAIYLFSSHKRGISSHQLARDLKISQKSAWYMLHRIRECFTQDETEKLEGVVQMDETFYGPNMANKHAWQRKEFHEGQKRTGMTHKTPILGMMNDEELRAMPIEKANKENMLPIINKEVDTSATVVSDGFGPYKALAKTHAKHIVIEHGLGQYVKNGFSTNAIEGFWSHFKRGIVGTYFHASDNHLGSYVDEFVFRYNTRKMGEGERFDLTLANANKTLSWDELIEKGKRRA